MKNIENIECDYDCPVRKTADIIGGKWTTLIVRDLLGGTKRYSELQRSLGNVSPKVLSERLKELEKSKIIRKKIYPTVPPKTEYSLTPLGQQLKNVVLAMNDFGTKL